jgi:predicted DNA binding CopG/RHH family protein
MKKPSRKLKQFPVLKTDEEAEEFVATADLSEYDFSNFKPLQFEFEKKSARVNMRLPESLIKTVKERARKRGVPYQRYIREMIELGLSASEKRKAG